MLFTKIPFSSNFDFATAFDVGNSKIKVGDELLNVRIRHFEGDIHHIQIVGDGLWSEDLNLVPLDPPAASSASTSLKIGKDFQLKICSPDGELILESDLGFGKMGTAHMFVFRYKKVLRFYGQGEKTFGHFELSDKRSKFWNTDALSDFHFKQWEEHPSDPYYASIPYLIVRNGDNYVGLLLHNPFPSWMDTGSDPSFFGTEDQNRKVVLGADDGMPSLWIIVGPTLAELTRKLQKLVGTTPRPPLWALGYHQCRWEYRGEPHLGWLHEQLAKHDIPNDGLWLDIDYMKGYRVFTYSDEAFPKGVKTVIKKYRDAGHRIVPIIDPGVKMEKGLALYEEGLKGGYFCLNPQGKPFVGFVWPGETVFPDFSLPKARKWWANHAKDFLELGFGGAWIDMNDPSTGAVDPYGMRFGAGKYPHTAFRNQYALGMAMATREGFVDAAPNRRPFLLSRSGYTGISRFSAIWTGDNVSNRFYLKASIPCTINLALSGVPFNGPDVGGFLYSTSAELMTDWTKAGFLFPFFRNHSGGTFRRQEPWTFGQKTMRILRHYIRLRYKLMPYLYQLFVQQERTGEAILRPIQYDYPGGEFPNDTFLVGSDILQAPFLAEEVTRKVRLPGKKPWFDARSGEWVNPGLREVERDEFATPLFFRCGAIVPTLKGERTTAEKDLRELEIHLFVPSGSSESEVVVDDGETVGYLAGEETRLHLLVNVVGQKLYITSNCVESGFGVPSLTYVTYRPHSAVYVNGKRVRVRPKSVRWTGKTLSAFTFGG